MRKVNFEGRYELVRQTIEELFSQNRDLEKVVQELRIENDYLKKEVELYKKEKLLLSGVSNPITKIVSKEGRR